MLKKALITKNYEVVETIKTIKEVENLLYFDIFIFQYPADYPTVVITIRTINGIHYIDKESIVLFGNREAANLKITEKVASRVPEVIVTGLVYELSIEDILSNRRISLTGSISNSIMSGYRSNYSSTIKWPDNESPDFITPNDFDTYLSYCSNYQGIRNKLKGQNIKLILKVNEKAAFEIVNIDSPIPLKDQNLKKIQSIVDAFPMWLVKQEIDNIELTLGVQ